MLRVGVVIDSFQQPAWVRRVLEVISTSDFAAITAVLLFDSSTPPERGPIAGHWYSRLDAARFGHPDDAFDRADARPLLDGVRIVTDDADLSADVILSFSQAYVRQRVVRATAPLARHGVWWADDHSISDFATSQPITSAELHIAAAEQRPDGVLGFAEIGTDRISLHRARTGLYWKIERLFARELEAASRGFGSVPQPQRQAAVPSNLRIARAAARALVRDAAQKFRDKCMKEQWFIAFRFYQGDDNPAKSLSELQPVIPPRDRLWADPFVISENGRTVVFVEEMTYREHRGGIACFEVERGGTWTPPRRVLERPYHLSYPCVFRWRGELFMVPESTQNKTVEIYRCVEFPDRWEFVKELLSDVSAADSTLFEHHGIWWMYTSIRSIGRLYDELSLYYAETPLGPWQPHPLNPLETTVAGGRCGGAPFVHAGRLYRAAQNGARRYGHSLQIREIVTLTPDAWEEREVATIMPDWRKRLKGTHTFNHADGVTVVDGLHYVWAV